MADITKYRAESDDEFPFLKPHKGKKSKKMKGPSGSTWNRLHLNWLGADYKPGCDLEEITPEDRRVASKIAESIEGRLNMTWKHICKTTKNDLGAFYADLHSLLSDDPKLSLYERSSTYYGSSQPREAPTPSPVSNRSRFMTDSPSAAQSSEFYRPPEVRNLSPSSDKGHTKNTPIPPSVLQTVELSQSLEAKTFPPLLSASHSNYIYEPQSPTQSSDPEPSDCQSAVLTTPARSQISGMKRPHSPAPDQSAPRQLKPILSPPRGLHTTRHEPPGILESSSSDSEANSESDSESESELESFSQQVPSRSTKPRLDSAQVSLPALDGFGIPDPRSKVIPDPGDISPPLSVVSGSSPRDEQPQLPAPRSSRMTAEEKKKAKKDKKDKDEKAVERLAGSFMEIINAALEIPKELTSELTSPPQCVFQIQERTIKVKHDVSMKLTAWKTNKTKQEVPIVTQVYTECKRKFHKKKPTQIQGQILAELLAAAIRAADITQGAKSQDMYTVYLISWHHVRCYISRLDIKTSDLERLKRGDRHCLLGLCVKETRQFDMVDPEERIRVAKFVALIAINGLAVYESLKKSKLIGRLRGPRPQGL